VARPGDRSHRLGSYALRGVRGCARLQQLLEVGARIQLDDFGTGYSSLTLLHHFPGDTLKIDRSFVASMAERDDSAAIIRSIASLAHNLGLHVIAEGIDHVRQVDRLRVLGCEFGQGFYFARPLPATEVEALLASPSSPNGGARPAVT
jgi:EAL domain-containing protein (putative c-di-GMP-specific phosphodiesterase class I)